MYRKGYPYREKKKKRQNKPEDHRPHVAVRMPLRGWIRREDLAKESDSDLDFYIPNLKYINDKDRPKWTRDEAQTLIDMYAKIAWPQKRFPEFHREMGKLGGHFLTIWRKQKGLCAMSKLPLLGGPGMAGYGIGIDLIKPKNGPTKGNIRLLSCILAVSRFREKLYRTQQIELPQRDKFMGYDVTYAISHFLYWELVKLKPFRNCPVQILFPVTQQMSNHWGQLISGFVTFYYKFDIPRDNTWTSTKDTYNSPFFTAALVDDRILLRGTDKTCEREIPLSNPEIDVIAEIIKEAKNSFVKGLHIALRGTTADLLGCDKKKLPSKIEAW